MSSGPSIPALVFDRAALRLRRARAAATFPAHGFLHERAAEDLVDRLVGIKRTFPMALDLGAGSGALARAFAAAGGPARFGIEMLIGADLSERALRRHAAPPSIVCEEEALPIAAASLELALSVLTLHAVNDLPGALIQIREALKPDGLLLAALFGGETLTELRQALAEAEIETTGGLSPRVAPMVDVRDLGGLLQRAGFALPVVDADRIEVAYATPLGLLADLRGMGETNVLAERLRRGMSRAMLERFVEAYRDRFGRPDGRVTATFEILVATGWAPHPSQQQPLRPGSAKMRLADALKTDEVPLR